MWYPSTSCDLASVLRSSERHPKTRIPPKTDIRLPWPSETANVPRTELTTVPVYYLNMADNVDSNILVYEKKMINFECPFTWNMNELKLRYHKIEYNRNNTFGNQEIVPPLKKLMRCIIHAYEDVKNNNDPKIILSILKDGDDIINKINERAHPEISIEALSFILNATKCFVFLHLKMETELKDMLAVTVDIDYSDKKQTSTIKACKSIAWSMYRCDGGTPAAIKFIREAIEENPNCDLWYFILGKMLRRNRRDENDTPRPNDEETESFEKAYAMNKNVVYGVFLAQLYREKKDLLRSNQMYQMVLQELDTIKNDTILLRIALGCTHIRDFKNARLCFEKVSENGRIRSMYSHYRGLFHMKQDEYREASLFFKEAVKDDNLPAESNYMFVMQKIDWNFDLVQYLLHILDKYKDWPKTRLQPYFLQLGFTYYKQKRNFAESLNYFLNGIEINSESKCLKIFRPIYICKIWEKNVYTILSREILPTVLNDPNRYDEVTNQIAKKLKEYCIKHSNTQLETVNNNFLKFHLKK